jgi:hypothetical protein
MSNVILNPDFSQTITLERRSGTWIRGEFVETGKQTIQMRGVVTSGEAIQIEQQSAADRTTDHRDFYVTQKVYPTTNNSAAVCFSDTFLYNGAEYEIANVNDWADYGFWRATAYNTRGVL